MPFSAPSTFSPPKFGIALGAAGTVLTSTGLATAPTFQAASGGSPGAPVNSIQFNIGGAFTGDADFLYTPATNKVTLGSIAVPGVISAPAAAASAGGSLSLLATNGTAGQVGGDINITAGLRGAGGTSDGHVFMTASDGVAGTISFQFGNGDLNINSTVGGDVTFNNTNFSAIDPHSAAFAAGDTTDSFLLEYGFNSSGILTGGPTGQVGNLWTLGNTPIAVGTNGTCRTFFDTSGNVVTNTAALGTTNTNGFLYVPKVAGAQTGVPASLTGLYANAVPMRFDTTNGRLYAYYGAAWHFAAFV